MKRRPARRPTPFLARSTAVAAALSLVLLPAFTGCGEGPREEEGYAPAAGADAAEREGEPGEPGERPPTAVDTIFIEGTPEPVPLRLHRSSDDFPLPFTTYVPADMEPSTDPDEGTAHFTAVFGGVRNEDAFFHVYVFPEGTRAQEAVATARGYKTGRGVPVSGGLEPISDQLSSPDLAWAIQAYRFLYQNGGQWYAGTLGVGEREGRFYMMVQHYPAEYGDGFAPRAALIGSTWHWADGSRLHE